jgi:SOS response regulatory protein OraA/RecX
VTARAPDADRCFERALDLLTRRPHFTGELERKLRQKGFSAEAIAEVIGRSKRLGYLDERSAVSGLVASRMRRSPSGVVKLRATLLARGAVAEVVEEVLSERCTPEAELVAAEAAAARWRRRNALDNQRLARHLSSRGFGSRVILTVLRSCDVEAAEGQESVESADL